MSNFRIGIVGNGYVAKFHVEALKYIGHHPTVLISSNTSKTAEIFAKKYSIKKIIKDKVFFQNNISNEIDGLVVACSTENTTKYIDWCQKNNIWLLAEKPISYNLNEISSFLQFNKCLVAFNRRFYPNIKYLKSKIKMSLENKIFLDMSLPERTNDQKLFGYPFNKVFSNCVHGVDIINFICEEPLKIIKIDKILSNGSRVVLATNNKFDVRINFLINSPTNFSLKVYGMKDFFDLTPFEVLTIYNQLEVKLPTKEHPVARYIPKVDQIITALSDENDKIKPGFLEQAKAFIKCIEQKSLQKSCPAIKDALNAQAFLQEVFEDIL